MININKRIKSVNIIKKNLTLSIMSEQLQSMFFSKETIAGLNKIVLQQSNYQNLNREGKEKLINILVKNMKVVYRSLDASKINKDNFNSIYDQFKKHSVIESLSEIKKTNVLMNSQQSPSDLKFERDFKSNPNQGNKFLDRPESTKSISSQVGNERKTNDNLSNSNKNFDSSLDQAFKPIVENLVDQDYFNNYDSGKNTKDINSRMESIQQMRQNELNSRNQKPPTPEFLKGKKTNPDRVEYKNESQASSQPNGKLDFQNMKSSDFNKGFQGLANDTGDNLMSLDNIDKPLIDQELTEDTTSFEDRLKRLQSDRDNLKMPQTNSKIDFTSETFPQSNINSNNLIQEQNKVRFNDEVQNIKRNDFDIEAKRNELIREAELKKRKEFELRKEAELRREVELRREAELRRENLNRQVQPESNDRLNELKNNMKMVNIEVKDDLLKMKQQIEELREENLRLQQNNDYQKINDIKKQIAQEFEALSTKNSELDTKTAELNLKEIEITKKDLELKQLIKNYDYLFRTNQLQIEVTSLNNESKYSFPLEKINGAIGIKLMSYSIPNPMFNIEENKNNVLKLLYKDNEIILTIPNGKYTIDELIDTLNTELANKNLSEININLNKQQKVIIEINKEEEISIIPTLLSTDNLGFTESNENKKLHVADRIWDLRMTDKVYLFLNNLSDEVPFGILHFNGKSVCQFKFEKPFNIDKLEIEFKDSKGLPINFYNLPHNLSFMIEKIN